jgi:hypothetical protein
MAKPAIGAGFATKVNFSGELATTFEPFYQGPIEN